MGREMNAQCKYVLHVGTAIEVCCNYNQSKTDKQVFRVKKLVGLPPQLEVLAVVIHNSGHDNMSKQCNHM